MRITNGHLINDSTFQFDVEISAVAALEITSYQCVFSFYCNNYDNDSPTFSYIDGSSQLNNKPELGLSANLLKKNIQLTFASIAGNDVVGTKAVRVGSFMVKRKEKFDLKTISLQWNFSGNNVTILTGPLFTNITNPSYFVSDLITTDTNESKFAQPDNFTLEQNYPNPFNPSTKIKFYLKEGGKVKLEVFNILGEKIADLIDEELDAGFHEVNFNGTNLASGVYIYRINVENKFSAIKKMILQK
jgi:hypothetical protein